MLNLRTLILGQPRTCPQTGLQNEPRYSEKLTEFGTVNWTPWLLLVNLQLTTDNGSLDIGLGEISAQTYREEQLDEVVVTGSAYVDCDLCHGSVLKTDLDFHKEYVCPERKITCPICHVSYKDYQGHNCNGVCARCGKSKEQCTCSTDIVDNNSNDGSGGIGENSGSGGGGGSSVIGNPGYNKYGQTFTYDDLKWKNISGSSDISSDTTIV